MKKTNMNGIVALMIVFGFVVSSLPAFAQAPEVKPLDATVLSEGFETGVVPPAGWTKIPFAASYSWQISTSQAHSGVYSARVPMRSLEQDEKLITPMIDLTPAYEYATLSFYCYTMLPIDTEGTVKLYLDKAGDGFQESDVIWSLINEPTTSWSTYAWREKHFDLTPYLGSIISLEWRFVETSGHGLALNNFYLDDVTISVPEITPKTTIGIEKIGYGSRFTAEIKNTGNYTATNIDWKMTVKGGLLGGINVTSNATIVKLKRQGDDHEDIVTVSSGSFRGFGPVDITITASTKSASPSKVTRHAKGFVILSKCYPMVRLFSNESYFD